MFCAFEGAARIVRLWGTGKVYEFGTPEYTQLIPPEKRLSGSRAAIVIDVHRVGTVRPFPSPSLPPIVLMPRLDVVVRVRRAILHVQGAPNRALQLV